MPWTSRSSRDRSKGFAPSARAPVFHRRHRRPMPEHRLKVLLPEPGAIEQPYHGSRIMNVSPGYGMP
jgi:hypothetical protein